MNLDKILKTKSAKRSKVSIMFSSSRVSCDNSKTARVRSKHRESCRNPANEMLKYRNMALEMTKKTTVDRGFESLRQNMMCCQ